MSGNELILALVGGVLGLGQILIAWMIARQDRADTRTDKVEDTQSDTDRLVAALNALMQDRGVRGLRLEERASDHGESLAGLSARVAGIERMSHDCEDLKAKVAVLEDWKLRNSSRWDQAVSDIAAMQRDIKTLFEKSKSLPDDVANALIAQLGLRRRGAS